jgi:hypothetical protein
VGILLIGIKCSFHAKAKAAFLDRKSLSALVPPVLGALLTLSLSSLRDGYFSKPPMIAWMIRWVSELYSEAYLRAASPSF